jgi:twitching motility protein PilT
MVMNSGISALIREGKIHQINAAMESAGNQGMITLDQSIANLVRQGLVSLEEALAKCHDGESLKRLVKMHGTSQRDFERALTDPLAQQQISGMLTNR